jgi:hypothetical protein
MVKGFGYAVVAHAGGDLLAVGQGYDVHTTHGRRGLTREAAWGVVKKWAERVTYITVILEGKTVWRASRLGDGKWCDVATGLPIKL